MYLQGFFCFIFKIHSLLARFLAFQKQIDKNSLKQALVSKKNACSRQHAGPRQAHTEANSVEKSSQRYAL